MTLPLQDTLETARYKVLLRCGMAQQGSHNANIQPVVDEFVRSAHHLFFHEVDWLSLKNRGTVALINDQTEYDFPDAANIGQISRIYCVDTDGTPYELYPAPTPVERNNAGTDKSRPTWYEILDGGINLYPPTDADVYPTLYFDYVERESTLATDTARLQIDSELVVLQATADTKVFLAQPGAKEFQDKAVYLLRKIKAQNASGESFNLGGYARPALYGTRHGPNAKGYNYATGGYYTREVVDQRGRLVGG